MTGYRRFVTLDKSLDLLDFVLIGVRRTSISWHVVLCRELERPTTAHLKRVLVHNERPAPMSTEGRLWSSSDGGLRTQHEILRYALARRKLKSRDDYV